MPKEFSYSLNQWIQLIGGILFIVGSILGIIKEIKRAIKGKKRRKTILTAFSVLGIIGIFLITIFIVNFNIKKKYEKRASLQYHLQQLRDEFYYDILFRYADITAKDAHPTLEDSLNLLFQARDLYQQTIYEINDNKLDLGVKIFKHDYLSYISVIISTLQRESGLSRAWADSSIQAIQRTFKLIKEVRDKEKKGNGEKFRKLIRWMETDKLESRLHYLWAWALAVKLLNDDYSIPISRIESQIDSIRAENYLKDYPLEYNYHLNSLRARFSEDFRNAHFDEYSNIQ